MQDLMIRVVPVGMIRTNCYVLFLPGRSDCLVIDPGAEPEKILQQTDGRHVAAILFTHGHFDHFGGAEGIMEKSTRVYIHEEDAPMLLDAVLNASMYMIEEGMIGPEATHLVHDGDEITEAGITLQVIHTPGHTRGSVCFLCGDVLFTGDTVMSMGVGRTDLPTGSEEDLRNSLNILRPYFGKYRLLGGHG
ncbi:MAG: MBL fold metallo-hydrolase [Clostridia bacterium]|nr:MBL fold metallo-hydrolase [Clostridia bacterium]